MRLKIGLVTAAALALVAAAGCSRGEGGDESAPPPERTTAVLAEEVVPGTLKDRLDLPGRVEAWREVTVSAEVGGLLEWRGAEEGDAVVQGRKLAVIDRENLELGERRSELALEQSRIGAEQAALAVRQAEAALARAEAAVRQAEAARSQAVEMQRKARAVREESGRDFERSRALYDEQLAPRSRVEELEMALEAASADMASAEEGVKAAAAGLDLARASRKEAEAALEAARENALAALSRVKSAEAGLDEARLFLRRSTILSPLDGYVDRTFNEQGELVKAQDPLFRILQTRPVKAVFHLAEKDVPFLREGMRAEVTVEALSREPLAGVVDHIGVSTDPATSTYPLEVRLENEEGRLRPGMLARLRLLRREIEGALSVPVFSVISGNGRSFLFLYEGGVARRRAVTTGIVDGERIEVLEGISPGDLVIVKGQRDLEDGQGVSLQ